ncbi:interferon-induced 44-like protein [Labeo rohita]|uniref:Interferon-induced 44-like protein n=1 Tax=Labeo rohita TaxID=84645 RepID=A0A498MJG2_LABRO|nr:interferon-induced 44-like protein [Labeo rohita]
MGLEPDNMSGSSPEDIVNAVFGHFDPKNPLTFKDEQFNSDPILSEKALCLVYILGADTIQFTDDRLIEKLQTVRQRISEKEIPQVIVMTKVDEACSLVRNDLRKIYSSKKIKDKMQECSDLVGVPLSYIYPVKNYHEEIDTKNDIDVLVLRALTHIVKIANDKLLRSDFNKEQPLTYKDQHYSCDPELSDQSFCLVYVIDANIVQYTDDRLIDKLKILCQRKGKTDP